MSGRTVPDARRGRRSVGALGEFGLIDRIQRVLRRPAGDVVLGIGDDTAALDTGGPRLLLATVDMQVEGRHFIRQRTPAALLGRRVGAVNLSDIAAMGGTPRWALVSLAVPRTLPVAWVDDFYAGLDAILGEHGAFVVGGNLASNARIVADLTLLGEVERGHLLTRAGARVGDLICVTGVLGRSAAGRAALDAGLTGDDATIAIDAHLAPVPRVRIGQSLAAGGHVTAMIDLSDGLAGDLAHIAGASRVGARVDTDRLPIAEDARRIAASLGLDAVQLALSGGEDFELLFTVPSDALDDVTIAAGSEIGVTVVGEILSAREGIKFVGPHGGELSGRGWDHFAASSSHPAGPRRRT